MHDPILDTIREMQSRLTAIQQWQRDVIGVLQQAQQVAQIIAGYPEAKDPAVPLADAVRAILGRLETTATGEHEQRLAVEERLRLAEAARQQVQGDYTRTLAALEEYRSMRDSGCAVCDAGVVPILQGYEPHR